MQRLRSRNTQANAGNSMVTTQYGYYGEVEYQSGGGPMLYEASSETMHDWVGQGYPRVLLTNPMTASKSFTFHQPFHVTHLYVSEGRISRTGNGLVSHLGAGYDRDVNLESNQGLGAVAWNRMNPGKPEINALQTLVELKDLPRMADQLMDIRKNLKSFKSLKKGSGLYLGAEFGWRPLLNDAFALGKIHTTIHKRLQQLKRDNGTRVRRRGTVRNFSETQRFERQNWHADFNWGDNRRIATITKSDRVWASIAFRYFSPDVGSSEWTRRTAARLLGLEPNLSLIYELTPWSWLADWFTNTGDVISNISQNAAESLVMDYGALMHETSYKHRTEFSGTYPQGYPSRGGTGFASGAIETGSVHKFRGGIMPYELGATGIGPDMSIRQLAILSALGLSRS